MSPLKCPRRTLMSEQENAITDTIENKTCCICGKNGGIAHKIQFHYGKKTGTQKTSKVDPAAHKIYGVYKGCVCNKCFGRSQKFPIIAGFFGIIMVLSGSIYLSIIFGMTGYPLALSIFYIIIGFGIRQSYKLLKKFETGDLDKMVIDEASKLLIKEKCGELFNQGYDTFWTPDEFEFMERKKNPPAAAQSES